MVSITEGAVMAETRSICLDEVIGHFDAQEDPRSSINQKHPFASVVVMTLVAVLAGAGGPTAIARKPIGCWSRRSDLLPLCTRANSDHIHLLDHDPYCGCGQPRRSQGTGEFEAAAFHEPDRKLEMEQETAHLFRGAILIFPFFCHFARAKIGFVLILRNEIPVGWESRP
jgi:hypothetical protein